MRDLGEVGPAQLLGVHAHDEALPGHDVLRVPDGVAEPPLAEDDLGPVEQLERALLVVGGVRLPLVELDLRAPRPQLVDERRRRT